MKLFAFGQQPVNGRILIQTLVFLTPDLVPPVHVSLNLLCLLLRFGLLAAKHNHLPSPYDVPAQGDA